jgi:hypothetical protein
MIQLIKLLNYFTVAFCGLTLIYVIAQFIRAFV